MTRRFKRFEPKLDNNRLLPEEQRLFFAISLKPTPEGLDAVKKAFAAEVKEPRAKAEAVAKALAPFVRLGAGEHSVAGKPIRTLTDYLELGNEDAYRELLRAVWREEGPSHAR